MKLVTDITTDKENEGEAWLLWHARDPKAENVPVLIPKFELNENSMKQNSSKDDIFDGWTSGMQKNKQDSSSKKSKPVFRYNNHSINIHFINFFLF